jgi:hypothetical protein
VRYRHPDRITEFSHRLAQIKFIILEIVIFIGFLFWLWDKVKHDFNSNIGSSTPARHTSLFSRKMLGSLFTCR